MHRLVSKDVYDYPHDFLYLLLSILVRTMSPSSTDLLHFDLARRTKTSLLSEVEYAPLSSPRISSPWSALRMAGDKAEARIVPLGCEPRTNLVVFNRPHVTKL